MPLLEVDNLRIHLQTQRGTAEAVRGISFALERGQTLGLVGESGCGKSITVQSLMGLLPASAHVTGSIRFDGQELIGLPEPAMCAIRGNRIGMFDTKSERFQEWEAPTPWTAPSDVALGIVQTPR